MIFKALLASAVVATATFAGSVVAGTEPAMSQIFEYGNAGRRNRALRAERRARREARRNRGARRNGGNARRNGRNVRRNRPAARPFARFVRPRRTPLRSRPIRRRDPSSRAYEEAGPAPVYHPRGWVDESP